jgi:hypothetical protein
MKPRQSAGEFSRTTAGQWTKSEKREHAFREIMECKKRTHLIMKKLAQQKHLV